MLADIIDVVVDRIRIIEPLESRVGHILLILCPRNPLLLKNIDDRGDRRWNAMKVVIANSKIVSSHDASVVRLRGMSQSVIVGEQDPLRCKKLQVGLSRRFVVILPSARTGEHKLCFQARFGRNY